MMYNPNAFPTGVAGKLVVGIKEIATKIVTYSDQSTQAVLMRVSPSFNDIVPPYLYENIKLTRRSSYQFFKSSSHNSDSQQRKLDYCQLVKSITFLDIPSPYFICTTRKLSEDLKPFGCSSLFLKVVKVAFNSSTITELTDYREKYDLPHNFLEVLPKIIKPRQLCITYPVFQARDCADYLINRLKKDKINDPAVRLTTAEQLVKSFTPFRDQKVPREVRNLIAILSESDSLYSLSLHQVGTNCELPPAIPVSRIYFRSCDCIFEETRARYRVEGCFCHTSEPRRREQLVCLPKDLVEEREYRMRHGLKMIRQRIKLVNPVLWDDTQKAREILRMSLILEAKGWEEEKIDMIGWDKAEVCGCCHTKEGL